MGPRKEGNSWENAEFVLRQIMDRITWVIAEVRGFKRVEKRQQRERRSFKSLEQIAAKIKALTWMIRHSYQLRVEAERMFEWRGKWDNWVEWTKEEEDPQEKQCRVKVYLNWKRRVKIKKKKRIMYIDRTVIEKKRINKLGRDQKTKEIRFMDA